MGKWCLHAGSFIFDQIVIKVAGNQDRHKSSDEFDFGPLVSMAHLYVFEMRFDLGTLDSGERSLPFGLLVFLIFFEVWALCNVSDAWRHVGPRAFILRWMPEKMKLISYIHTIFLHHFCSLFMKFWYKSYKWQRNVINQRVWLLCSAVMEMTWRQLNVMSANQLLHYPWCPLHIMAGERLPFIGVWTWLV